jgi:septal ring factor EnvC (AmiA/AmiB activator)
MRTHSLAGLVVAVALGLSLTACQDKKARQENEQLKAQVASTQQDNSQLRTQLDQVTSSRDALQKENDALKAENEALQEKKPSGKTSRSPRK